MGQDAGTCRFLQSNRDRREIYAIVERDGSSTAYGPLTYEQVDREVVHRLGLDRATLYRATHPEVADPGNLDAAGQLLDPLPSQLGDAPMLSAQVSYLFQRRRFGDAVRALTAAMAAPDFVLDGWTSGYYPALGWAQHGAGDEKSAHMTFAEGKQKLEALRARWNDNGYITSSLAKIAAGLGDADGAEREADHCVQLGGDDQYHLAGMTQNRVIALALAGRNGRALALLEAEMKKPIPFYAGDLRWSPDWDKLRDDPRFQKLLADAESAQVTVQTK